MAINTINRVNYLVSKKLNIDKEIVEKINDVYWRDIRKALISMEDNAIVIKELGTLVIGQARLRNSIRVIISKIRKLKYIQSVNPEKKDIDLLLKIQYESLRKLLVCRNKLAINKIEKLKFRKLRYEKDNSTTAMDKDIFPSIEK